MESVDWVDCHWVIDALIDWRIAVFSLSIVGTWHRFIHIWQFMNAIWMSLLGVAISHLSSGYWNGFTPRYHFILNYLRYWGLCFIQPMHNTFVFDAHQGLQKYTVALKRIVLWQITLWEGWRQLPHEERPLCRLVCQHIRFLSYVDD
jgi:hypothetical protein